MRFTETTLKGAYIIELEKLADERGFFARTFCREEFQSHGIDFRVVQCSTSFNVKKGTLRGMHYQIPPHEEGKLVRCASGAIYDVVIDLRPDSPNFMQWMGMELTAEHRRMLYVPEGFAHGFQTLEDSTEVSYLISEIYHPECARGVRWDDPSFGILWPLRKPTVISDQDSRWSDYAIHLQSPSGVCQKGGDVV